MKWTWERVDLGRVERASCPRRGCLCGGAYRSSQRIFGLHFRLKKAHRQWREPLIEACPEAPYLILDSG